MDEKRLQELDELATRWESNGLFFEDDGGAFDVRALIAEVRRLRKFEQEPVGVNQLIGL